MATLLIRNLDESVRDVLRQRAKGHGLSLEAEARAILAEAAKPAQAIDWSTIATAASQQTGEVTRDLIDGAYEATEP